MGATEKEYLLSDTCKSLGDRPMAIGKDALGAHTRQPISTNSDGGNQMLELRERKTRR